MPEKTTPAKKLRDKSTKQEMLESYQTQVKQMEEKRQEYYQEAGHGSRPRRGGKGLSLSPHNEDAHKRNDPAV